MDNSNAKKEITKKGSLVDVIEEIKNNLDILQKQNNYISKYTNRIRASIPPSDNIPDKELEIIHVPCIENELIYIKENICKQNIQLEKSIIILIETLGC